MENEKLIMFSFQNMYLQGIHAGIQSSHAFVRMAYRYRHEPSGPDCAYLNRYEMFWEWARNHHTVSIKNGGDQAALISIVDMLLAENSPYPWEQWREGEKALNGALTNVSIIVPEHVYGYKPSKRIRCTEFVALEPKKLDGFDKQLYTLLTSCKNMI